MTNRVDLRVFGPAEARLGGEPVDVGGATARKILAALVAGGDDGASQDAIVEAVWGESAPATARKSVQKAVSQVRSSLGSELIETTTGGYALDTSRASIDVRTFEALASQATDLLDTAHPRQAVQVCEEALALAARGEPFADLVGTSRHLAVAVAVDERRQALAETHVEALMACERVVEAVAAAETLVAQHPLRESAWGLLMQALYRTGRQSEALRAYRRLNDLLAEQGLEPSPLIQELEQRMLERAPELAPPSSRARRLPAAYTSFVGRHGEITDLSAALSKSRLVSLVGPGGSGKTRLALELAHRHADPAWFIDLAQIEDPLRVPPEAAAALGIAAEPGAGATEALRAHLADRRALVIVDNCEHVLGAAAALVHTMVQASDQLTVLSTSREPLGLTGEAVFALHPLELPVQDPSDAADALRAGAVQLFVERATAADPAFSYETQWRSVVAICRRLDGIPLAIELAARRLGVTDIDDIRSGILERLDQLTAPGDPVTRHRTMEGAIDWSHRLLAPGAQRLFAALSVFPGSFTRRAVAAVMARAGGIEETQDDVDALVSASMVERLADRTPARYRLLEPIRAFAARRAAETYADGALGAAHAAWVLDELEADPRIIGPGERETLARLSAEDHHFAVALGWATHHDVELALRLTIASTSYLSMVSYRFAWFDELQAAAEAGRLTSSPLFGLALANVAHSLAENFADHETARRYGEEALELAADRQPEVRVIALMALASAARNAGQLAESIEFETELIALADEIGADLWAIRAVRWMAFTEMQRGNYQRALGLAEEAKERGVEVGSDWVAAKSLWVAAAVLALSGEYRDAEAQAAAAFDLFAGFEDRASPVHVRAVQGDAARLAGDLDRAAAIYGECLDGFREVGDRRCTASTHRNLALVHAQRGDVEPGLSHIESALEQRAQFGDEAGLAECAEALGHLRIATGEWQAAVALFEAARLMRGRAGSRPPTVEQRLIEDALIEAHRALTPDAVSVAEQRGAELAHGEALLASV